MAKCPRCFNILPADTFAWTESCPSRTEIDAESSSYRGHAVPMGRVVTNNLPGASPSAAAEHAANELGGPPIEVCPICHYHLPTNWRNGIVTCIAMAGARFTGKTVFIAVMVKQLQRHLERMGFELDPATPDTAQRYRDHYEKPLYEERGILPPTPRAESEQSHQHDPLIFSVGVWNGTREFLAIRDVAGEDLERSDVGGVSWAFFCAADAVFFMFDPMRVEEVKDQLRDLIPTNHYTGGDPRHVLRTVMKLIGHGNPKLGVVLSKFDALQALQSVRKSTWGQVMSNSGAAFARDPALIGGRYHEDDGLLLDMEVRSLLQKLDAGPMFRAMSNPQTGHRYHDRFFAVSALGDSPRGERLDTSGISPFRCMDPLRWVLADRNVL